MREFLGVADLKETANVLPILCQADKIHARPVTCPWRVWRNSWATSISPVAQHFTCSPSISEPGLEHPACSRHPLFFCFVLFFVASGCMCVSVCVFAFDFRCGPDVASRFQGMVWRFGKRS